jgi:hypothetical protein
LWASKAPCSCLLTRATSVLLLWLLLLLPGRGTWLAHGLLLLLWLHVPWLPLLLRRCILLLGSILLLLTSIAG